MEPYYALVLALLILACADVVVGVSNDAVNFLNSAIGSKVAPMRVILIVAGLGVFVGASMSSGMMEIARKGIFNPSFFTFESIMVVFVAVMVTDILLLDFFNTLGLPTSTTVSIVFELLGASVATGLLVLADKATDAESIWQIINYSKALQIIAGIFLSIVVAFTVGAVVQWISRLIFTFRFERNLKTMGPPFAGAAISIIVYFTLIKGMKGAVFLSDERAQAINEYAWLIVAITFVASYIIVAILQRLFRFNPLKVVVLMGTFALAMAFAGNDLVNFIGVPIAGFQAYTEWQASGLPADVFTMDALAGKVATSPILLYGAGLIMVLTLWFSGKALRVTETTIKLSSQASVDERFKPNALSRGIVNAADRLGRKIDATLSRKTNLIIDWRFRSLLSSTENTPAFDLVRASVNLMIAAILIAFASSLKLPLSTTYVSFMVAMGTSMADRAWGAGSAAYRVAGVINVIAGWFMTAIGAFTAAGIVAVIIYYGGLYAAFALFAAAALVLVRSNWPKKKPADKKRDDKKKSE